MVLKAQNFQFSTNVALAYNTFIGATNAKHNANIVSNKDL
jgi:hypothetical protein